MKILFIADDENKMLWEPANKDYFDQVDLIISCGDLKAEYLSYLVTVANKPVFYVHGNHDDNYEYREPEGCDCIEDRVVEYKGIKIAGLGGSMRYRPDGVNQYTEAKMASRCRKLLAKIKRKKGLDVLVTHAAARGQGDMEDLCHLGFDCFNWLVEKAKPRFHAHGHIHLYYSRYIDRVMMVGETRVINVGDHFIQEV